MSHTLAVAVLKPGLVTQATGSAYIETGRTKVICAVLFTSPFLHQFGVILTE